MAQNSKIDSLKSVLAATANHEDYKILWDLSLEYFTIDENTSFNYAEDTYASALQVGDSLYIVKSMRMMGLLLRLEDKLDESITMLNSSLKIAQRNNLYREVASISNALANGYSMLFEFDEALDFNLQALVFYEKEGDVERVNMTLANIGFVHYRMGSVKEAIEFFKKSLDHKIQSGDMSDLDLLYSNLGFCYVENNKEGKEARVFFEKALNTCTPDCSNSIMTQIEMGLAKTYLIDKDQNLAERHFLNSLRYSQNDNDQRLQIEIVQDLIDVYLLKNDLTRASFYFNYVESLPEYDQYAAINAGFAKQKAEYFSRLRNFKLATSYQQKYSDALQKERADERSHNLVKIKAQFVKRENVARINDQKKLLALQEQALEHQRVLNFLIGAVVLLTITIIMILIKENRRKHVIRKLLDLRVRERTMELEINRDQLELVHNEQAAILKRVSNDLGASLATMKSLSDIACDELPADEAAFFKKAESMTERMVDYMRNYSQVR